MQVSDMCYLESQARLLGVLCFGGAGGGAVQGTAAASSRPELAAFSKHLPLALSALWSKNKKIEHYRLNAMNTGSFNTAKGSSYIRKIT